MANFTEKALAQTLFELLETQPIDKITVKEITDRCGLNRNTFYYHYHDVYELLDAALTATEDEMFSDLSNDASLQECLRAALGDALKNRNIVYNIYRSVRQELLEAYFYRTAERYIRPYVEHQAEGLAVAQEYIDDITHLLSACVEGLILDWLRDGMVDDPFAFCERVSILLEGGVRTMLKRAAGK